MDPKDILDTMRTANSAFEAGMRAEREHGEAARRLKRLIEQVDDVISETPKRAEHRIVLQPTTVALYSVIFAWRAALAAAVAEARGHPPCADPLTPEQRDEYEEDKRTDTLTHGRVDREGWE